ncbi:MAG: hypothetical protein IT207_00820 [Fimbriimonadaceae bacterium]|nr:hypothetical protein [Fimbriimonadaceae bacterium]
MRLCRFALLADPDTPRSGIYHEGRFYETDGLNAVGVHETSEARLLTPVRVPILCRMTSRAGESWSYAFADPAAVVATGEPLDAAQGPVSLELRIAAVCGVVEAGSSDPPEILGYLPIVTLVRPDLEDALLAQDLPTGPACAGGSWLGPFIVTREAFQDEAIVDETGGLRVSAVATLEAWEQKIEDIAPIPLSTLVAECEKLSALRPGELVAGQAHRFRPLGGFAPGDRCRIDCGLLGVVIACIA